LNSYFWYVLITSLVKHIFRGARKFFVPLTKAIIFFIDHISGYQFSGVDKPFLDRDNRKIIILIDDDNIIIIMINHSISCEHEK